MIKVTRKEACELIRSSIGKPTPTGDTFDRIVFAVNNDAQVRDFLMGLPQYYDTQQVIDFLCGMANDTKLGEDIPFISVASTIAYETGNMGEFFKHVGFICTHAPNYSLNTLLMSVAKAGMPGKMITQMRNQLHTKVMEVCYKTDPDFIIERNENGQYLSSSSDVSSSSKDA